MKYSILALAFSLATISGAFGQSTTDFFTKADAFFRANVSKGRVHYRAIKENPSDLNELLEEAQHISVSKANANEYQAFYINGYNLLVIKGVVDNYPLRSPLDVGGFFDGKKYEIGGKKTTLNDIENKLLRAKFPEEARFHFVLVCGGLGCPPIIAEAYLPATLDAQLDRQTRLALNDPQFIQLNKNKVKVSQIFEWYKGDFKQNGQGLIDFINKYKAEPLPEKTKVSYYPYDWTLNEAK
ncbi:DUF547 domain-containing protein [Zobellia galactanivorans]|uniref:DUF547 domain-containing protein n=1 Tax=Zobellia galactanivorans (strain DSM 12802 / CCUG 47099 / CIP 106680 / NCIMB 13871 / Dsij) TaxID=63186 RepID=UPI0026E202EA|nr:DUF547 domain-containing protein [Zobellia galactanivorans]MDO6808527.1 DUF547 domain-containing protein [Zobellia galactanivorans]